MLAPAWALVIGQITDIEFYYGTTGVLGWAVLLGKRVSLA